MNKKLVVILIGPPGSGKGTQAGLLADKLNLYYFETSKIIEHNVMSAGKNDYVTLDRKKYFLSHEREFWRTGVLCTPAVVSWWVQNKFKELDGEGKNLVIAGSPRTLDEGREVMPLLKRLYGKENIKIVEITLSAEQTIWRNQRRRICELMRHPILSTRKEFLRLTHCPLDGSKLIKRKGLDSPESIRVRLKEYKERTFPLIQYFKKEGFGVGKVNGEQSVEKVFKDILKQIKS
ncbi:MAG: hypothetical protein COV69_04535 [Parcubacteria group bacterium CG11_big_fil_rev_8_21_14_0_20_39_14]|nr:MAG: hypothetical protein COV69_04535 [Parcubacteria group bacterium CG11_big_fil_rev_8_21_14_0_20_39_14]PIS35242.1 MAG: hypothetical protein COT36_03485 [Parcubacteria group bacterium CG08_land_8_20_14_0_20_38_56]